MGKIKFECVDVGSENCPCYLPLTNDCITCSRLQGKEYCDCDWKGVCVYNEFLWNKKNVKNPRKYMKVDIIDKVLLNDNIIILKIKINKNIAVKFNEPGTFVFLKGINEEDYYSAPISVLNVDIEKGQIDLAIQISGAKTKKLLLYDKKQILIRGPYRNGILGLKTIKKAENSKIMIIGKGIGLAPIVNIVKCLNNKNNTIDLIHDVSKAGVNFVQEYVKEYNIKSINTNLDNIETMERLNKSIVKDNYDILVVCASDYFQNLWKKLILDNKLKTKYVITNNHNICCGEGICGACSHDITCGSNIKMCKCQIDPLEDIGGGEYYV